MRRRPAMTRTATTGSTRIFCSASSASLVLAPRMLSDERACLATLAPAGYCDSLYRSGEPLGQDEPGGQAGDRAEDHVGEPRKAAETSRNAATTTRAAKPSPSWRCGTCPARRTRAARRRSPRPSSEGDADVECVASREMGTEGHDGGGGDDDQRGADGHAHRERERDGEGGNDEKAAAAPKKPVIAPISKPAVRTRASWRAGQLVRESPVRGDIASRVSLRNVAAAAASMMIAKAAISARPPTACPCAVPAITPGRAAAMNPDA